MQFEIETTAGPLTYDTDPCSLTDARGNRIDMSRFAIPYTEEQHGESGEAFSPDAPVVGKTQPRTLKIQLGLGCNYACSYCSQGGQKAELTATADADAFLRGLDSWLTEAPEKIELWGGEPMLYWKKIEILAPSLRARFPQARMSIVTNGTLLTRERARFLFDLGFSLAVSHDGPGQHLRGEDPFDDAEWSGMIRDVFRLFGDSIAFNAVITKANYRLIDLALWYEVRMGFPIKVNIEDVVTDYGGAEWAQSELEGMSSEVRDAVSSGLAFNFPRMLWAVQQFMLSLAVRKPLDGSHQVCQMDRRDHLAVDLHGNVLTCQNAGAESGHKIGTSKDLLQVRLDTARSWATRPNCRECPVVHLCYGSCMFLTDKDFESSCRASYHYNIAILSGAIKLLTGANVVSISGWKPAPVRKTFLIKAVSA